MLSKNMSNKKCGPKLVIFNAKRIEKLSDDFCLRKLTLFDTSPLHQFLGMLIFWQKTFQFSTPASKLDNL